MKKYLRLIFNWPTFFLSISGVYFAFLIAAAHDHPVRQSLYVNLLSSIIVALASYTVYRIYKFRLNRKLIEPGLWTIRIRMMEISTHSIRILNRPFRKEISAKIDTYPSLMNIDKSDDLRYKLAHDSASFTYLKELNRSKMVDLDYAYGETVAKTIKKSMAAIEKLYNDNSFLLDIKAKADISFNKLVIVRQLAIYQSHALEDWKSVPSHSPKNKLQPEHSELLQNVICNFCKYLELEQEITA